MFLELIFVFWFVHLFASLVFVNSDCPWSRIADLFCVYLLGIVLVNVVYCHFGFLCCSALAQEWEG